ncbi:MAG: hypothetical protein P4L03_02420 [Terracidiphilus sp.]|nr:hypothetical protein [Terracidiphilus sp.]
MLRPQAIPTRRRVCSIFLSVRVPSSSTPESPSTMLSGFRDFFLHGNLVGVAVACFPARLAETR